jgi:hypothetical protein
VKERILFVFEFFLDMSAMASAGGVVIFCYRSVIFCLVSLVKVF